MNRVLIEIPTWLGDAIMTTPAIENIVKQYPNVQITLFGSYVSIQALKNHPNVNKTVVDESRKSKSRLLALRKIAKSLGSFDLAISFRRTFTSKLFIFFVQANKKANYKRLQKGEVHQVIRYNDFVNYVLKADFQPGDLKLYLESESQAHFGQISLSKDTKQTPILGINPGATYGSAKRWYPEEFAKVAIKLSNKYDIVIFGGVGETKMANDIEFKLKEANVVNYQNLAGKTTIAELIQKIAGLSLFITNDSGPMHIAAAFKVPTIAIFGPTKHKETHQWNNPNEKILRREMECAPCMKRVCPLEHHNCMRLIKAEDVLSLIVQAEEKN